MKMPNKVYDTLKYIVIIVLPAVGTLYFAISTIWGLPFAEEIQGTILAVDTCLGTLLQVSKLKYQSSGDVQQSEIAKKEGAHSETQ